MPDNIATLTSLMMTERPTLLRLMLRIIKNRDAAEDAVQSLYEKIQKVENSLVIANPHAYLYRLASNQAIDHARKIKRQTDLQDSIHDLLWLEDETPSSEQQTIAKRELEAAENIINAMPEPMKTIFCLNRFHGLSQTEIANRFGRSVPLINRYIQRALDMLSSARQG
ncbi:RNA polymerase sigma factor [Acetobacter senegalensis]|uniref:RNA polymerase sigma factor n=1 Tax=Acetobacter senegalensis TaxID=446692 RepID=UPI00264C93E1|nr:RNA polymerase sigma factor [Acetobacter senegalensis]MDN7350023.1 RNA polymerase sigma factor [Acetobacter senegalensis]